MAFDSASSPEELAVLARDSRCPPDLRADARVQLAALVLQTARHCCARFRFSPPVCDELLALCWEHVEDHLHNYRPDLGPFLPWLHTVLIRLAHTLRRQHLRDANLVRNLALRLAAHSDGDGSAQLAVAFARLRNALDHHTWPPSRAIDYFAVLLVRLRVEIALLYRAVRPLCPAGEIADSVACWLPWRPDEQSRVFRPDLPTLADLWSRLAPRLDHVSGLGIVLDALDTRSGESPVPYNTLIQWFHRAHHFARTQLGEEAWREHGFAHLLRPSTRKDA